MILFPHAKINLGLHILGERSDGYHELQSILYPIGLCDMLELIPSTNSTEKTELTVSGDPAHETGENDLVLQAFRKYSSHNRSAPLRIHLHKRIPSGAGLGGGSSDAAHLLRYMAGKKEFDPFDPRDPISGMAASLGSDLPFFLQDAPAFVSGKGEQLRSAPIDLGGWQLLLIVPPFSVSTAEAYKSLRNKEGEPFPKGLPSMEVKDWRGRLQNHLESAVFSRHPEMQRIVKNLYKAGASYASMTGSGSGIYGLFESFPPSIPGTEDCFIHREELPPISGPYNK